MAELRLDLDSHLQYGLFDSDLADICIDHDGEWGKCDSYYIIIALL